MVLALPIREPVQPSPLVVFSHLFCEGEPMSTLFAMFGMPGMYEMMIVLVICLLLFGNRLPSIMRNLGASAREFQKGVKDGSDDEESQLPDKS